MFILFFKNQILDLAKFIIFYKILKIAKLIIINKIILNYINK